MGMDTSGNIRELAPGEPLMPHEQAINEDEAIALRKIELGQRVAKLAEMRKRDHHNQRRRKMVRQQAKHERLGR